MPEIRGVSKFLWTAGHPVVYQFLKSAYTIQPQVPTPISPSPQSMKAFIGRKRVSSLFLNASRIEAVSNQTFNGLTDLDSLHLEDNRIRRLRGFEFANLTSLSSLSLQGRYSVLS